MALPPHSKEEEEVTRYGKGIALQLWLFGYEVPGALTKPARTLPLLTRHARHAVPVHARRAARGAQLQKGCARAAASVSAGR